MSTAAVHDLVDRGVRIIAPPMWMLVTLEDGNIVPSLYAKRAKAAGFEIITWTLERSGTLTDGGGWYYQSVKDVTTGDAAMLEIARILWANRGDLRRSVRLAWWPGHSTGRYAGSTWFADHFGRSLEPMLL